MKVDKLGKACTSLVRVSEILAYLYLEINSTNEHLQQHLQYSYLIAYLNKY